MVVKVKQKLTPRQGEKLLEIMKEAREEAGRFSAGSSSGLFLSELATQLIRYLHVEHEGVGARVRRDVLTADLKWATVPLFLRKKVIGELRKSLDYPEELYVLLYAFLRDYLIPGALGRIPKFGEEPVQKSQKAGAPKIAKRSKRADRPRAYLYSIPTE